jgi:hypothetical protein
LGENAFENVDLYVDDEFIETYWMSGGADYTYAPTTAFSQIKYVKSNVSAGDSSHYNRVYVTWDEYYVFGDGLYKDIVTVAPQQRIFFAAATDGDKDRVRVEDTPGQFANNAGAIQFELYHAGSSGDIHLSIDSVLLYNVCPPPAV